MSYALRLMLLSACAIVSAGLYSAINRL